MKIIKFRAWDKDKKAWKGLWIFRGGHVGQFDTRKDKPDILELSNKWGKNVIFMQFTGYQMANKDVYFDDLVSNNLKTSKEVIRQIVEHKGCKMMKRIKGNSSLSKYISLHDWHKLNFEIIGNIYENPELIESK